MKRAPFLVLVLAACSGPAGLELPVDSRPPGAAISLDGEPTGKVTPATIAIPPEGEHDVELTLAGHVPFRQRLFQPSPGQRLVADLNPLVKLRIETDPPGARVLQGEKVLLAATPGELELPAGTEGLRAELDGHVPVTMQGHVAPDRASWTQKLERAAWIEVASKPAGLAIFLDRKDTDQVSPARVMVTAGKPHELAVCRNEACAQPQVVAPLAPGATGDAAFLWTAPKER